MEFNPFQLMQDAVDIISTSPHPNNKVAATLAGGDIDASPFKLSRTNYWPAIIGERLDTSSKIGNSSGTIHAETACIIGSPYRTEGGTIFITDPPCPNCMKNMAEAGIKALYIDHKGFAKDFAHRRGEDFVSMSMRICQHAGISVYKIFRAEENIIPIYETPKGYIPPVSNPPLIDKFSSCEQKILIEESRNLFGEEPFAFCLTQDQNGKSHNVIVGSHPSIGFTKETMGEKEGKYSFLLQPLNHLQMLCARRGYSIEKESLYSSRVPTARELVNLVGAGIHKITIGDIRKCRDEWGIRALKKLKEANVLNVSHT